MVIDIIYRFQNHINGLNHWSKLSFSYQSLRHHSLISFSLYNHTKRSTELNVILLLFLKSVVVVVAYMEAVIDIVFGSLNNLIYVFC